jgi:hypothetical protein
MRGSKGTQRDLGAAEFTRRTRLTGDRSVAPSAERTRGPTDRHPASAQGHLAVVVTMAGGHPRGVPLALGPGHRGDLFVHEHLHDLQPGAHGQGNKPSRAVSARSAIVTLTASGNAHSGRPGSISSIAGAAAGGFFFGVTRPVAARDVFVW